MPASTENASAFPAPAPAAAGSERPPRAAATIVVVRDGTSGLEVLLSRRAERGDHNSGAWVFPGGIVEKNDALAHAAVAGLDDETASRRLGLASGGLDYYVAAIRECFEESGLLFARAEGPELVDLDGSDAARLAPWLPLVCAAAYAARILRSWSGRRVAAGKSA